MNCIIETNNVNENNSSNTFYYYYYLFLLPTYNYNILSRIERAAFVSILYFCKLNNILNVKILSFGDK